MALSKTKINLLIRWAIEKEKKICVFMKLENFVSKKFAQKDKKKSFCKRKSKYKTVIIPKSEAVGLSEPNSSSGRAKPNAQERESKTATSTNKKSLNKKHAKWLFFFNLYCF